MVSPLSGNVPNCFVSSCNETSHTFLGENQKRCGVISYQPVYSEYSACSAAVCQGQGTQTRNYSCNKLVDGSNPTSVDNSNCSSLVSELSISCDSPAGNVVNPITGGEQTLSCSAGSTVQTFQSVSCQTQNNYEANGQICSLVSYQPQYGSYQGCTAPAPCDGEGTESASLSSCQKLLDGQPVSGGTLADCSSFDQSISQSCFSPLGQKQILPFNGGTKTVTCSVGESLAQGTVDIDCDENFIEENGECVPNASGWKQISAGSLHTCAVTTSGQAFCWGSGIDGRLGNGGMANSLIPVAVTTNAGLTTSNVASIEAGSGYTCTVTTSGRAFCWGTGTNGQLGNGGTDDSSLPVAVIEP